MLSRELEQILNSAFANARKERREFMTVENLFLSLLDEDSVIEVLKEHGADIDDIRAKLTVYLDSNSPTLKEDDIRETQPTLAFQRVLQRAVFHIQSAGGREVSSTDVLNSILKERGSESAAILTELGMTSNMADAVISHVRPEGNGVRISGLTGSFGSNYSTSYRPRNSALFHIDNTIRQAISQCWDVLPKEVQTAENVEKEILRITKRAIKNFKEDLKNFSDKNKGDNNK